MELDSGAEKEGKEEKKKGESESARTCSLELFMVTCLKNNLHYDPSVCSQ